VIEALQQFGDALIGLFGVMVGGIIVSLREWLLHRTEQRRDGSYSAIRLICVLDEYAHKCMDVAGDDGYSEGRPAGRMESGEEVCEAQITRPDPIDYPSDIAWRSLDETLMHRILALPNKARSTDRYVSGSAEHAFPPDYEEFFEPRREGYARLGVEALDIVDALRKQYGVSVKSRTDLGTGWDPKEHLVDLIAKFEKRDADRLERGKASHAKFLQGINLTKEEASK
jgi:hypothetical protein